MGSTDPASILSSLWGSPKETEEFTPWPTDETTKNAVTRPGPARDPNVAPVRESPSVCFSTQHIRSPMASAEELGKNTTSSPPILSNPLMATFGINEFGPTPHPGPSSKNATSKKERLCISGCLPNRNWVSEKQGTSETIEIALLKHGDTVVLSAHAVSHASLPR